MEEKEFLKELISRGRSADEGYCQYANLVAVIIPMSLYEHLEQLVNGPIHDRNVISKSVRDELLFIGLAVRVCHKGEQGYTAATYFAHTVLIIMKQIRLG